MLVLAVTAPGQNHAEGVKKPLLVGICVGGCWRCGALSLLHLPAKPSGKPPDHPCCRVSDCCSPCSLLGRPQHPVCNTAAGVVDLAAGTPEEHAQLLAGLFLNARQQVAVTGSAGLHLHRALHSIP